MKCETVPSPCSNFLPYNRSSVGIKISVLQYINRVYTDLHNSSHLVMELYTGNSHTVTDTTRLNYTYEFITNNSTFIGDYMTSLCAAYFQSCSADGPVLGPCRTFYENTHASLTKYVQNVTQLFDISVDYIKTAFFHSFPYASNSEDKLCVQGKKSCMLI